jgi:hypothetical protein
VSDSGLDALAAEQAVEAKLAEAGADTIRRHTFDEEPEAAPEPEGTPAEEQARNGLGQFTTDQPDETADEVVDDVPEDLPEDHRDPAVAAFLAKYGNDPEKALAGAVHLQRKMGEQSNEIGENRRLIDELSRLSSTIEQSQQAHPQQMDQATVDWYDEQVMANPSQALAWAQQQGNQMLVQRGLSVWKEIDPYEAAVYTNTAQNQALAAQVQAQMAQQARLPQDTTVHLALQTVLNRNPHFTNYSDAIEATLAKHQFAAKALEQAASSGDPAQIEGAIETLYSLAVGDTLQTLALAGPAGAETTTSQDVVTPTVSETREATPEPSSQDKFREAFRQESDRVRKGVWVAD